ncbi:MAG TPA: lactate 2-monooxygenase [Solirubrobacterales bacterium]|nr:lactate 2-monooxygenase [Solirubrobacterales bacterium]
MKGPLRQTAIYLRGVSGGRPRVPIDFGALEERARESMSEEAFAYIAAGAGGESSLASNREAFRRWRIVPRVLRDVGERDTSVELFGRRLPAPFLLSPIGVLEMAHKEADLAVARAAAAREVPMVLSNQASTPMEDCAAAMGDAPRWFQLYWSTSNELVESLVSRAERCGCEAIVVTLDTTILGWRTRDLDLAYLPFLRGKGIAQYTSDPVFTGIVADRLGEPSGNPAPRPNAAALRTLVQVLRNYPDRALRGLRSGMARGAVERFVQIYSRPSLTWDDLSFLRDRTELPILLKGVLHPDDAVRAIDEGINGIVVSNHGGRQIDGVIPTLEALPGIAAAVGGRVPILLDSGIRGGGEAFKALALGATAVGIGRPYVYGLAAGGEAGVGEVIDNFVAEFDLTMGLAGCSTAAEVGPEALAPAPWAT